MLHNIKTNTEKYMVIARVWCNR